jgi:hypothetical protein
LNAQTKVKADSLASAMALAFAEIEAATKDASNPHFKSKYADLGAVIGAIKPALINHGLYFTQHCRPDENGVVVETVLTHSSGEKESLGSLFLPANKRDAQGFGSALTYARRYALLTAFGVPTEDDDGNAATKSVANDTRAPAASSKPAKRDDPFPQGPAKNRTELKTMGREFWRQVEGCGDIDELDALRASHKELQTQIAADLPAWWNGGDRNGEPFDGLATVISNKQTELTASANEGWRGNPLAAG